MRSAECGVRSAECGVRSAESKKKKIIIIKEIKKKEIQELKSELKESLNTYIN